MIRSIKHLRIILMYALAAPARWSVAVLIAVMAFVPGAYGQTATTTLLTMSPSTSPVAAKTAVTLTATVAAGGVQVHPGQVVFCDTTAGTCTGLNAVGVAQLTANGTAVLRFTPGGGDHNFIALFAGTSLGTPTYASSVSAGIPLTVSAPTPPVQSAATIASTGSPGDYSLTSTIVGFSTVALTGDVSFYDTTNANYFLGTATLGPSTPTAGLTYGPTSPIDLGGDFPFFVAAGDFNGDGVTDLAVQRGAGSVTILLGSADGSFTPASGGAIDTGTGNAYIAVGDFNQDGILDLALSNQVSNTLGIYLGDGTGHFTAGFSISTGGTNSSGIHAGDFNGDGIADVAIANQGSDNVSIFLGNGDGTFTAAPGSPIAVGRSPYNLAIGDFNGDKKEDLAVANAGDNNITILLFNGTGFTEAPDSPVAVGAGPTAAAVGDFNRDGFQDLAIADAGANEVTILKGDGTGRFAPFPGSPVSTGGAYPANVAAADFNEDGFADLALENNNSNSVAILLGDGNGGFTAAPGSPFATGENPQQLTVGNFDGLGPAELAVANGNSGDITIILNAITETASATLTGVSVPGHGTHDANSIYAGDANYSKSTSGTTPLEATPIPTTLTLTGNPSTISYGQHVTLTATLAPALVGALKADGETITFKNGTTVIGTGVLTGGVATLDTATLPAGIDVLTAVYPGDLDFLTSTSADLNYVVIQAPSSTTTLTANPTTVMYGNATELSAVVTSTVTGPTGNVRFYEGTTLLGESSVDGAATAVLPVSSFNVGLHTVTATYVGDINFPASTSNSADVTVTKRTNPTGGAALIVAVNNASRTTTEENPPFGYKVVGRLVNGDTDDTAVTGTPVYATAAGTTAGTFDITVTGLTSANYEITFVPGTLTVVPASSTTTLVASPASSQYGDPVTLTATVAAANATGTVSFYDSTTYLGDGAVSGTGVATLTTATFNAGAHNITATYNGDATYASSKSAVALVTVAKKTGPDGGAALTVTVQDTSREYATSDPEFEYVVSGTLVNGDQYDTAVTGTPVYSSADTLPSPAGSTFPVTVTGLASQNYVVAYVPGTLTIVIRATTTTLTASVPASQYGDPVTLTAAVAPITATGRVLLSYGSKVIAEGTLSRGTASVTSSALNAGTYEGTVTYLGDGNYGQSTSSPVTIVVNPRTAPDGSAALTVTVNNASRQYGQGNPAFTSTVTGTLFNGDTYATAVTGTAVYSTPATITSPVGTYPITVEDLDSTNYVITFVNGTLTVSKGTPSVTVASSLNPSVRTNSVIFTAEISAGATGSIAFMDGSTALGTGTISGTTATFTTSALAVGTHPVTAVFPGDANYNTATSPVLTQVVNKEASTVELTASPQTLTPGQPVTLTATVPSEATGTVTFYDNGTAIGTAAVSSGTATLVTSSLTIGVTHTITASYGGDANYTTSVSPPVVLSLTDFAVASTTGSQLIPPGASASYAVTVSSVSLPFTGVVTMTATGLPPGANYSFSPSSVTPGSAGATTTLTVSVPAQTAGTRPAKTGGGYGGTIIVAAILLPLAAMRRRKMARLICLAAIGLVGFGLMTGCGAGGYFSQTQQTYTITVTGTSGALVHSTTVTLTVE